MKRPRLLLADDHKIFVEGLRNLLEPEFEVVKTVENGQALVAEAHILQPDLIIVDISMPCLNGIEAIYRIRQTLTRVKIVVLSMHTEQLYIARAFRAGASGYVAKHADPAELLTALRRVLGGGVYRTPDAPESLSPASDSRPDFLLTPRQREVLQLVAEGLSAKEVAALLHISSRTVEFHKYRMMETLKVKTSASLIRYAVSHGFASPP